MLNQEEKIQYQRQLIINNWDEESQEKLKQARIFIAGTGGLGSAVSLYCASAGIGSITICDNDSVELSNLNRQILHGHKDINKPKVDSAGESLRDVNPYITITAINETITEHNCKELIAGSDLVIDCLDNFKTRFILNKASIDTSIPFIHGGVENFQGQISFFHPAETPCLACIFPEPDASKKQVPIAGATAGFIGSLQSLEAIKYLTGIAEPLKNKILFADCISMQFKTITVNKNKNCRVCGNL